MHEIIQSIKIAVGVLMLFLSSFGIVFGIVAVIDPVGAKMSDDGDPFGLPPTFVASLSATLFYAGIFFVGIWIIFGTREMRKLFGTNLK